jgi:hypothetical protein
MSKTENVNYTAEMVATLEAAAPITNEVAVRLAEVLGKDVRSVRAKASRMGIYVKAEKTAKNGDPIERKEAIVADIADLVGANMEGLEKAPKAALVRIRTALSA